MDTAFDSLVRLLDADDVKHQADPEQQVVTAGFRGKNGVFRAYFKVDADEDLFQIFVLAPVVVPEGGRPAIAEAITRANYGMKVGKFEMDLRDGELRFHVANLFPGGQLENATARRLIGIALNMVDRYFPAFMSIIYANETPEDAVGHVERMIR